MANNKKRIFLDYAAGAPVRHCALQAATEALSLRGNAGGLHQDALLTRTVLETARTNVAKTLSVHPDEIIFSSGGTEGNNLCLRGVVRAAQNRGMKNPHIITTVVEHPSVKEVCDDLAEREEARVSYLGVDENGVVDIEELLSHITADTVLVSVMHVNNETGSIMPITEIGKRIEKYRREHETQFPVFHSDACQSGTTFSLRVPALHVDLLTLNGAKLGGPSGSGAIFAARNIPFENITAGGEQEQGIRPGTQSLVSVAGFTAALLQAQKEYTHEYKRLAEIKQRMWKKISALYPEAVLNGSLDSCAPQIINISFPGIDNEEMVLRLDAKGVSVATRSACRAREGGSSYVVEALGSGHYPENAIRFSFGKETTADDIDAAVAAIEELIPLLKKEEAGKEQVSA